MNGSKLYKLLSAYLCSCKSKTQPMCTLGCRNQSSIKNYASKNVSIAIWTFGSWAALCLIVRSPLKFSISATSFSYETKLQRYTLNSVWNKVAL
jgi:hypothetical protein